MPTPFPSRQAARTGWSGAAKTKPTTSDPEWRCTRCDKLLGVCRDGRMHLRFARWHEIRDHLMLLSSTLDFQRTSMQVVFSSGGDIRPPPAASSHPNSCDSHDSIMRKYGKTGNDKK